MNSISKIWLSFAASLMLLLGIFGFLQRKGNDRAQSIPALVIGTGLIVNSALGHQFRRKKLLLELKKTNDDMND